MNLAISARVAFNSAALSSNPNVDDRRLMCIFPRESCCNGLDSLVAFFNLRKGVFCAGVGAKLELLPVDIRHRHCKILFSFLAWVDWPVGDFAHAESKAIGTGRFASHPQKVPSQ